ncbi:Major facilitator superfamily domain-containing protein 6-B, partial [Stegodyphus mimosarum]
MRDPWLTLPVALLHGPTFGIFYASMTMYGKTEAPPGTEASVQALLAVAFEGVGAGIGSILGGIGFDKFGSRNTFLYAAVASFILLMLNLFAHLLLLRTEKYKEPERTMEIYTKIEKADKTANRTAFIQP